MEERCKVLLGLPPFIRHSTLEQEVGVCVFVLLCFVMADVTP